LKKNTFKILLYYPIIIALIFFLINCKDNNKKNNKAKVTTYSKNITSIPEFNKDSAYYYLKTQVDFGPRYLGSKGWQNCAAYLEQTLKRFADTVITQNIIVRTFTGQTFKAKNFIASYNPHEQKRILLAAHWDTRPFADKDPDISNHNKPILGANDGASGVAVLLEIARILSNNKINIGIDIILFDAEDYGVSDDKKNIKNADYTWGLGSQYWAKNPHSPGYTAEYGILLDMVGSYNPLFAKEAFSLKYAADIVNKVWNIAASLGYASIFSDKITGYIMDDHYFVNTIRGIPMIDIIHHDTSTPSGFMPQWHTLKDNIDIIDKNTLEIVGKTLLVVIWDENNITL